MNIPLRFVLRLAPVLAIAAAACNSGPVVHEDPVVLEHRTLSISVSPRLEPPPTLADFIDAQNLAYNAGVSGSFISATWSRLEPTLGSYAYEDTLVRDLEQLIENGQVILLGIQVINTTARETPRDLAALSFDAPEMMTRFHRLIDRLFTRVGTEAIQYISIGNEVDVYLASHPEAFAAYRAFLADAVAYIHSRTPSVKVGVTITHDGMTRADSSRLRDLASIGDVVIATYYPLMSSFAVKPPSSPLTDLPQMARFVPGKQLILQEVGYPSSAVLGSSEEMQAEFLGNMFTAWAHQHASIPFLNVFLMHDMTHGMCEAFAAYYGLPDDERFKAFLCSLGLRTSDGRAKFAWGVFAERGRRVM